MGARIPLEAEHLNLALYLTTTAAELPAVNIETLQRLMLVFGNADPVVGHYVMSHDDAWRARVSDLAMCAYRELTRQQPLDYDAATDILRPIRSVLSSYRVYGLVVDTGENARVSDELLKVASTLAIAWKGHGFQLIPDPGSLSGPIKVLQPLPAVQAALAHRGKWPGIVLWLSDGRTGFVSYVKLREVVDDLIRAVKCDDPDQIVEVVRRCEQPDGARTIVHLSDLHFGLRATEPNVGRLQTELIGRVAHADRIVVTGDTCERRSRAGQAAAEAFLKLLEVANGKPAVVVPGNHDQRYFGNIRAPMKSPGPATAMPSANVVDDAAGIVFLCLDSNRRGSLARGRVTSEQLVSVAGSFEATCTARPRVKTYLRVALVHHHPYSFETEPQTLLQRGLRTILGSDERVLCMTDASVFTRWCADWQIPLILHGHKHQSRVETREIASTAGTNISVSAVGCGSSLGAEGTPLSYCSISWDPVGRSWTGSVRESANGGPFVDTKVLSCRIR